jgi:hypothetical protein
MSIPQTLKGEWRIVEMEVWDKDFLDLMGPARIAIDAKDQGEFSFGCVNGAFSALGVEASLISRWTGNDEMDEASGEISIDLEPDGSLTGEICFDNGDESEFRALPWTSSTAC